LGGDFWLKIVSFGNAPLLGLLTTIFSPESRISGGSSGAQAAVLFSLCAKGNDPNLTKNGDRPKNWTLDRDPYYMETNVGGMFAGRCAARFSEAVRLRSGGRRKWGNIRSPRCEQRLNVR
jgi:hypothetical protein